MIELDHLNTDLSGMNLIEASAGTGKTYAISCLYLRLLIEKDLLPEQILVVTFTEAATKELIGRIRGRIREAVGIIDGHETKDTFLTGLVNNVSGKGPGRTEARQKLDRALNAFDTASIFTIHGFCLRALKENAFESGSLYDTELITDPKEFLQEIVDDFWRVKFFAESSPLLKYALQMKYSPEKFIGFLQGMLSNPQLEIIPRFSAPEIAAIEKGCRNSFESVRKQWQENGQAIKDLIETWKGLSRSKDYYKVELLPGLFAGMDAFTEGDNPFELFTDFDKFSSSGIARGKTAKGTAPSHLFFERCEELQTNVDQRILALKSELIGFCRERLPVRKREANIRFFDDLLNDLDQALSGESGDALARSLRGKYRAALIDEFQDTDSVQYDIFKKIYAATNDPLFLIGDPKQAIYSFRGADIFAYMKASADVKEDKRFTLTTNWRSTPGLLDAFNTIFTGTNNPFVYNEIPYYRVVAGKDKDSNPLELPDGQTAPFQIWCMPAGEKGEPINISTANKIIPPAVAAEISRLLQPEAYRKATIDGKPLAPGDIAVIVRSHRQAGYIQEALRDLNIPSVLRSDLSVFATDEARDVCTLLAALADPASETKVRAALVTDIFGLSGDHILNLLNDEPAWDNWLEKFREYHQTWLNRGFMVMAHAMMAREGVRGRLLRHADGERRLTNLLHCFEILHHKVHQQKLGSEGLVTWFNEQVSAEDAAEEYQIRLETDEKAVKIMTVHVSKGLEYPVVFCPFLWGGIRDSEEVASFHKNFTMVKDFGSPGFDKNRILAQKEELAENLRLLYVALTRAKYLCFLCAGKITSRQSTTETSSLSYLFHATEETRKSEDPVSRLANEVKALTAQSMQDQLMALQKKNKAAIAVVQMPEAPSAVAYTSSSDNASMLSSRKFSGVIKSDWRVASFSSITSHEATLVELPDHDGSDDGIKDSAREIMESPEELSIFTFPRGAQAGNFFHKIFENLDFPGSSSKAVGDLVEKELEKFNYDKKWQPHVCNMIQNVISTPLLAPEGTFKLADIRQGGWISEMEFFFPLKFITSDRLSACLRKSGARYEAADMDKICTSLNFKPVRGMLKGFMDMVFEHGGKYYLVDWKSNHLGYRVEDYRREAMKREMERNFYPLQYLLYTVALNRYLSMRFQNYDYKTRFGGVMYVFLRGVSSPRGEAFGYFRDIPPLEMIDELTELLIQMEDKE
jgi:exodeoxyribonuclease V beta subunit